MKHTALRVCLNADVDPADEPKSACRSIELGVPAKTREVAKQPHQLGPKATIAAKAIIDGGGNTSSLWEVPGDRRLAFEPPADVDATSYAEYRFLAQAVIVGWTPCAGPCTVWRAFRRDGKLIVNDIDDTVALLGMGAHRLATFGEKLEVYDVDSAKLVHSIAVLPTDFVRAQSGEAGGEGQADPLLELANGDLVVVAHGVASLEVVIANPDSGAVKRRVTIPKCDPAEAD